MATTALPELVKAFQDRYEHGEEVVSVLFKIIAEKAAVMRSTDMRRGLKEKILQIDAGHKHEVLQDKMEDLQLIRSAVEELQSVNTHITEFLKKSLKLEQEEIAILKKVRIEIEDEAKTLAYYREHASQFPFSQKQTRILLAEGDLEEADIQERAALFAVVAVLKKFHEELISFEGAIKEELTHGERVLRSCRQLIHALEEGLPEHRDDIRSLKGGFRDLMLAMQQESAFYIALRQDDVMMRRASAHFINEEILREHKQADVKRGRLRVLVVPCTWGFGPVSQGISLLSTLSSFEGVVDAAAILAPSEFCDFAEEVYDSIERYELKGDELYDRPQTGPRSGAVVKFIDRMEDVIARFKPTLVIDSLGYLGTIIAKIHGVPVVKIDQMFPELSKLNDAQRKGIALFNSYQRLAAQGQSTALEEELITCSNNYAFQWLGDVLADYLVVPTFYNLEVTPSILQYRGNKNIFFVNPCMNQKARLLLEDAVGVKTTSNRALQEIRSSLDIRGRFTHTIVITTGGIPARLYGGKQGSIRYLEPITAFVRAICSLNDWLSKQGRSEKIGVVLFGALMNSREAQQHVEKRWDKYMKWWTTRFEKVHSSDALRWLLAADTVVTQAGQTSLSELLTLNKTFLVLPATQGEQKRNLDFVVEKKIGLPLRDLFDSDWNPSSAFNDTILELIHSGSQVSRHMVTAQRDLVGGLQEINSVLAYALSHILGYPVTSLAEGKSVAEVEPEHKAKVEPLEWDKKISVVIPLMDKEPKFLDNCLFRIRQAEASEEKVEILVIDFESKPEVYQAYQQLCNQYHAKLHQIERRGRLFNLSLLRNYGARQATGDYIAWCDVDILIPSNTFERVKGILIRNPKTLITGRVFMDNAWRKDGFYKSLSDSQMRRLVLEEKFRFGPRGFGGFIVSDREWVEESRGFDEAYVFWGFEDTDFRHRTLFVKKKPFAYLDHFGHVPREESSRKKGWFPKHLYPTDVVMIHQTHGPAYWTEDPRLKEIMKLNQIRQAEVSRRGVVSVNSPNWGTNKIKVLRMVAVLGVGGVEIITLRQCEAMMKQGNFDVRLVVAQPEFSSEFVEYLKKLGVDVKIGNGDPGSWCEKELLDFKPEIALITNLRECAENAKKIKGIFTEMKVVHRMSGTGWSNITLAAAYKWVDRMICQFSEIIPVLEEKIKGFDARKVIILGNGVEDKWFTLQPSSEPVICMTARVSPEKCMVSFVNIVDAVRKVVPNVKGLIIGGANGQSGASLLSLKLVQERIDETQAPIAITKLVNNVERYLPEGKVFLFTSATEGFPSGFWQAVAAGLVPVTTAVGNIGPVLEGRKEAYLCKLPIPEGTFQRLPIPIEEDLTRKCIEAITSVPDVQAIKDIARPFGMKPWSRRFISLLTDVVGSTEGTPWQGDDSESTGSSDQKRKKRIMRLLPVLVVGGMEMAAIDECEALARNGFEVCFLIFRSLHDVAFVNRLQANGVDVRIAPEGLTEEQETDLCMRQIYDFKPDVLMISSLGMISPRIKSLRDEYLPEMKVVYRVTGQHERATKITLQYSWVDLMIIYHDVLKDHLLSIMKDFDVSKTAILANAVRKEIFDITPKKSNTVVMMARVAPVKCLVSFVNIINDVRKDVPDVQAIIIGGVNDQSPESIASGAKIAERIQQTGAPVMLTGLTNHVADHLAKGKVFLFTSSSEGFGIAFWEGVAAGLVPVTTNVADYGRALKGSPHAYLCDVPVTESADVLPRRAEIDLAKKCVQALRSDPDVEAIKQLAMPYHVDQWSRDLVNIMDDLLRK